MYLKKDLLLLHGALGAASQLDRFRDKLSYRYNIYTFDFIGHGKRSADQNKLSIKLFADQLKEFVADNGLEGCDVFGYSMGGYVALHAASEDQELFRKIVTLGTKFDWNPDSSEKEAAMLNADKIIEKVPLYAGFLEKLHGDKWRKVLERTAELMKDLGNKPELSKEKFEKISYKVLISVGEKDKMVSVDESRNVSSLIRNCGCAVLPFTTHTLEQVDVKLLESMLHYFLGD